MTDPFVTTPPTPEPTGLAARLPMLRPLVTRDFRLLWAGESVSLLGDQFYFIALTWLVLGLTGSGLALSAVLIAASVPRAALMLLGGALTDRLAPRSLLLGSNVLRGLAVATLAALVLVGRAELWHLIVLAVLFGSVDAVFYPALNTIVPMLVPGERLAAANALVQGTNQLMGLVGPALAGILVAAVGSGPAFVVDATSFVIAALALVAVRGGRRVNLGTTASTASIGEVAGPPPSLFATIGQGARYSFGDPAIRTLILLSATLNLAFNGPISVGLAWLAENRFAGGPVAFGFMFAGFGAGAVLGAVLAGSTGAPRRQGLWLLAIAAGLGIGVGAIGLAPNAAVTAVILGLIGLGVGYVNVLVVAWLQARVDPSMLGRVMSLVMLGSVGLTPVSLALAGLLVDRHATFMFVAAGGLVIAAVGAGLAAGAQDRLDAPLIQEGEAA